MTKLLDEALEAVRRLPAEVQDEIARALFRLAQGDTDLEPISPVDLPAILEGLADAGRRDFASESEIEAAFRRFDR
ncbi:MAG TPA: hypothetical protein VMG55_04005 [Stellaceae bacterium]|nr:hypothetical protein [Stellaceae bacterium]